MIFEEVGNILLDAYNSLTVALPPSIREFVSFILIAFLIVLYSIFIWKFYQSISRKNLIKLNLSQYNTTKYPFASKIIEGGFFFLEYILIMPFLIFLWFAFFSVFLILLTETANTSVLLILSATTIAAIRMISYYQEDLAKDVAKLVPFTLLATSLLNPEFFSVERVLGHIQKIPNTFPNVFTYLMLIISLELVLRFFDFIFGLFGISEKPEKQEREDTGKEN